MRKEEDHDVLDDTRRLHVEGHGTRRGFEQAMGLAVDMVGIEDLQAYTIRLDLSGRHVLEIRAGNDRGLLPLPPCRMQDKREVVVALAWHWLGALEGHALGPYPDLDGSVQPGGWSIEVLGDHDRIDVRHRYATYHK